MTGADAQAFSREGEGCRERLLDKELRARQGVRYPSSAYLGWLDVSRDGNPKVEARHPKQGRTNRSMKVHGDAKTPTMTMTPVRYAETRGDRGWTVGAQPRRREVRESGREGGIATIEATYGTTSGIALVTRPATVVVFTCQRAPLARTFGALLVRAKYTRANLTDQGDA